MARMNPRITLILGLTLVVGCSKNPEAQFAWRDSTDNLIPDARKAVQKTVNDAFGTPHDLIAWERLPVDFGGVQGTVQPAAEGSTPAADAISVQWDGPTEQIKTGAPVIFLAGQRAASKDPTAKVASFNAKTSQLTLTLPKGDAIVAGDRLAVGFGSHLQLGRAVYMKNCHHCHGVAGDGNGPTAQYLNPRPRDYRLGLFKFTGTQSAEKASRDDLTRIVQYGIPGTYMPSFLLMKPEETKAVVEYVRWLAMRGELEKRLNDELADYTLTGIEDDLEKAKTAYEAAKKSGEKPEAVPSKSQRLKKAAEEFKTYLAEDFPGTVNDTADFLADAWKRSEDEASLILPKVGRVDDDPASRERGRLLYMSDKTKCYTCHGATGRGNGPATEDFWKKPGSNETYAKRGLHDTWGNPLPPRDLTRGQYRGGRRPLDVYRRIYAGIKGTPMPAFGGTVLKDEEIWDVVNYVMSIPFEAQKSGVKPAPSMAQQAPLPGPGVAALNQATAPQPEH